MVSWQAGYPEDVLLEGIEVRTEGEAFSNEVQREWALERGAKDVGEMLRRVEGVSGVRRGPVAQDVLIRGFQRDNIAVLVDGARVYGACPNRMDPPTFHIEPMEFDRLRVQKGPFEVRHSGSMGGLIEVVTPTPKPGWDGELFANYGSFESTQDAADLMYGSERFSLVLGGSYRFSRPYEAGNGLKFTEVYPEDDPNRYQPDLRKSTAYSIKSGWTKLIVEPLEGHQLTLAYTRVMADNVLYPYLLMDADLDDTDRINVIYTIDPSEGPLTQVRSQFFWSKVRHDMSDARRFRKAASPRRYSMRTHAQASTYGGGLSVSFELFGAASVGVDGLYRSWDATTTMFMQKSSMFHDQASIPDVGIYDAGVFFEHTSEPLKGLGLTLGFRVDSSHMKARKDRRELYQYYFARTDSAQTDAYPSGYARVDFPLFGGLELYGGFGHGVRSPDPQERYFALERMGSSQMPDQTGNPGLKPTTNDEVDLGVRCAKGQAVLEASFFFSDLKGFIVPGDLQGSGRMGRTYKNVSATMYGNEAIATLALVKDLTATAGVMFVRGKNDSDGTDLSEIPPFKGKLGLRYDAGGYFGEIEGIFAAPQDHVDSLLNEEPTAGYAIANLRAGCRLRGLKAYVGVLNLFDRAYYEHLSYLRDPFRSGIRVPEPGRTFYASLSYSF